MSRRARRRVDTTVFTLLLLFGASLVVAGTQATFSASTTNQASQAATDSLVAPTTFSAVMNGYSAASTMGLTWNAGSMTSGASGFGYRLARVTAPIVETGTRDGNPIPTCDATRTFGTTLLNGVDQVSYTDSGAPFTTATATNRGMWFCYQLETAYPTGSPVWFSPTKRYAIAQAGYVIQKVQIVNGAGKSTTQLNATDQIVITFNQPVDLTTAPPTLSGYSVCTRTNNGGRLYIAQTGTGACGTTTALGYIQNMVAGASARWTTSWAWSANNTVLTITLGLPMLNGSDNVTVTWGGDESIILAASLATFKSASGSVSLCADPNGTSTSGPTCRPFSIGQT